MNLASDRFRRVRRRLAVTVRLRVELESRQPPPAEVPGLTEALGALPMAQRKAVVLHHLLDLPVDQVAVELGVPVGTVKSRLAGPAARWRRCWRPRPRQAWGSGGGGNHG